jgi:hypothetical protein
MTSLISTEVIYVRELNSNILNNYLHGLSAPSATKNEYPFFTKVSKKIELSCHYSLPSLVLNGIISGDEYEYLQRLNNRHHQTYKNFLDLEKRFDLDVLYRNPIQLLKTKVGFVVYDGSHRLALLMKIYNNSKLLPKECFVVNNDKTFFLRDTPDLSPYSKKISKKIKKLNYFSFYNGWRVPKNYEAGYHSLEVFGLKMVGQRNCLKRIKELNKKIEISGKNILDLGCNIGGMLWHIDEPGLCVGVDFDKRSIKVAKFIKKTLGESNHELASRFRFYHLDLNDLTSLKKFLDALNYKFDYIFMLSMGSWVNSFSDLINVLSSFTEKIVFETNNDAEFESQKETLKNYFTHSTSLQEQSLDDISGNVQRKTFLYSS